MTIDVDVLPEGLAAREPLAYRRVVKDGQMFDPAPRPDGITKGAFGVCFENCSTHPRFLDGSLAYCEGLVKPRAGAWVRHAWLCAHDDLTVVEVTWKLPGRVYVGVKVDKRRVLRTRFEHRQRGVFSGVFFALPGTRRARQRRRSR